MKCLSESDTSAAFGSKKENQILVAGTIDFGTQSHFGPKRTPGMDSAPKAPLMMPQPIWASDQYLRSLSGGWALVFVHETEAILGSYVMQQQGSRWNLTFILTDSLYGYAMEPYAKGEVQRRATRGCIPFGAVYAPAGPFDPYMSQKHRRSERWTLGHNSPPS
jgi:hypothetical protein